MPTVYGIPNCDTCRAACRDLDDAGIAYVFHDVRATPVAETTLRQWLQTLGTDALVNRRSTTWRQLASRPETLDVDTALALLVQHSTLIKRPVFARDEDIAVGYPPKLRAQRLAWLATD